jgi:hypothetical protein
VEKYHIKIMNRGLCATKKCVGYAADKRRPTMQHREVEEVEESLEMEESSKILKII